MSSSKHQLKRLHDDISSRISNLDDYNLTYTREKDARGRIVYVVKFEKLLKEKEKKTEGKKSTKTQQWGTNKEWDDNGDKKKPCKTCGGGR